jgi:predicted transposase YbfD/YdcC
MAVCAVLSGAEGWEDIAEDGEANAAWLGDLLDWPPGMPGPDTCRRVLSPLDPAELPPCFIAWTQALSEAAGGEMGSIDGKTLRHAFDPATATAAIPMVRAWARAHRVVWGPLTVEEQSHAMPAMPKLLHRLDLQGAVGTIEALGCQQEIAKTRTEPGADDVLALQDNPPTRAAAVTLVLHDARDPGCTDRAHAYHETVDGDHGRLETRRYWITAELEARGAQGSWSNLHSVGMVEARRAVGDMVQGETR